MNGKPVDQQAGSGLPKTSCKCVSRKGDLPPRSTLTHHPRLYTGATAARKAAAAVCDGARGRQLHPVTDAPTALPVGILLCFFSGQGSTVRAQLTLAQGPQGPGETGGCSPECCWGGGEWTSQSAGPRPAAIQSLTPLPPHTILGQITGQGEPRCGGQASSRTRMTGTPLAERPAHTATPCTSCRPRGVMQGSEATTHGIRGGDGPNPTEPRLLPRVWGGWTGSRCPISGSQHGHRDTSSDCTGLGDASPPCGPGVT